MKKDIGLYLVDVSIADLLVLFNNTWYRQRPPDYERVQVHSGTLAVEYI